MDFKEMTVEELEIRRHEIADAIEEPDADLDALETEAREIKEELETRKEEETKKAEIRAAVAGGEGVAVETIETKGEEKPMDVNEIRNSKEYIDAYAKYIKTEDPAECRALLTENVSGGVPVPEMVYDIVKTAWNREGITSRVRKAYVKGNLKVGFEISGSDAAVHTEGAAAVSEETLILGTVQLIPKSIKKLVRISDESLDMSSENFLRYIYDEVTYRIAKAAAKELITIIEAAGTVSTTTSPAVGAVTANTIGMGTIAQAIANLSDEAANPVIMMNKLTWAAFKSVQYANGYGADPFEGLPVEFNENIKAFSVASTGDTYVIVGDLDAGALMNFPNGDEITFKYDDITEAAADMVRIIGREFVGVGVVAPNAFVKIKK